MHLRNNKIFSPSYHGAVHPFLCVYIFKNHTFNYKVSIGQWPCIPNFIQKVKSWSTEYLYFLYQCHSKKSLYYVLSTSVLRFRSNQHYKCTRAIPFPKSAVISQTLSNYSCVGADIMMISKWRSTSGVLREAFCGNLTTPFSILSAEQPRVKLAFNSSQGSLTHRGIKVRYAFVTNYAVQAPTGRQKEQGERAHTAYLPLISSQYPNVTEK